MRKLQEPISRVVVAFSHGDGFVLLHQSFGGVKEFISDCGGGEQFDLDSTGVDFEPRHNGICLGELHLVDDGPGDYPDSREVCLSLVNVKSITEDEWRDYRNGDWPWAPQ